ncbi:MAG: peptidoglycan-binding domain-containing protein [Candidatus Pacearchaeota archaeon]|jgi:hypothetical protein
MNLTSKILFLFCLVFLFISLAFSIVFPIVCPPTGLPDYKNPVCINEYLDKAPQAINLVEAKPIFNSLNQELISRNIDKYSQEILEGKYVIKIENSLAGITYSTEGKITPPNKELSVFDVKTLPVNTEITITQDKILVKLPGKTQNQDYSTLDFSKLSKNGPIELENGAFKLPGLSGQIEYDNLLIKDGKMYLPPGSTAKVNGVNILNTGSALLQISPLLKSTSSNSVSFQNDKLYAKSSEGQSYDLNLDNSRQITVGNKADLTLDRPSANKDFFTNQQIQTSLKSLGYDVPQNGIYDEETKKAVLKFQKDYNARTNKGILEDGIVGTQTRTALEDSFADYSRISSSNAKQLDLLKNDQNEYQYVLKDNEGNVISTINQGQAPWLMGNVNQNSYITNSKSTQNSESSASKPLVVSDSASVVQLEKTGTLPQPILQDRYSQIKDYFDKVAQSPPQGLSSSEFKSVLVAIAQQESTLGHPNGQTEIFDAYLMGYDVSNKANYGLEPQLNGASNTLKSAFNNENPNYAICNDKTGDTKIKCILSVYNDGQLSAKGLQYSSEVYSSYKAWNNFLS